MYVVLVSELLVKKTSIHIRRSFLLGKGLDKTEAAI